MKGHELMNLLEKHEQHLRGKISAMQKGTEAGLVAIFGDGWESIGTSGEKRELGKLFKAAVSKNKFPEIQWVRIENSGRDDVYRKS
jgi:hypothetical protein